MMSYTIVGFFVGNNQNFVEHVEGDTPKLAVREAYRKVASRQPHPAQNINADSQPLMYLAEKTGLEIVAVFEGRRENVIPDTMDVRA